jgi:two-component system, OmpR family, sensor kinase
MSSPFRSIRWRLQFWHTCVLFLVIASSSGLVYWQARKAKFADIDTRLVASAGYLDVLLRSLPPHEFHLEDPDRPPGPGGRRPPPPGPRRSREEQLAQLDLGLYFPENRNPNDEAFFAIWRPDGSVLKTSDPNRARAYANEPEAVYEPLDANSEDASLQRGVDRVVFMRGPFHSRIMVGKPIAKEFNELRTLAWQLCLGGGCALAIGLVGGWWVSARVLRPVAQIAATASSISAANLSERIDSTQIDQELMELANVLNDTFGRLEMEFKRQVRFTADASHELRTPLAVLYTTVELALARPRGAEEYRDTLGRCLQAAARMRSLVDGLLTLARADSGRLDLDRRQVDLRQLVEEVVETYQPQAMRAGISLIAEVPADSVPASVDSVFMARVLENLVANAARHSPAGGSIVVSISTTSQQPVLRVADTGTGIDLADQPRIFERFFRADQSRSRSSGGSGLGLAICKSIVEAHGGVIRFESTPGKGTTFFVVLDAEPTSTKHSNQTKE